MASFLTDLAKPYVEKLVNGAIAESSYICCFTCIAKDFEEEKSRLEVERTTVKQRVDVATRRGEDIEGNALFWEEEAEKLIQEDTRTKQKCFFGFCSHCIWRYRRGKELTNKKEQIKKLMETGKELAIGLPARLPDVERYSSQHYISFKSRESKYMELFHALKDDNNYIIGLQGMGGTGKTTLVTEVGKKLKQTKQFTQIIDTTVSFSPDIKKIQDDIAGPLGLEFHDCNESDRPKKLWSRLTNGEKILLILDDVWGEIDFNEIGIPYSDNHKGCRILVTTRNLLVCNRLGCSKTIQLDLLSEEDAWIMFKRHAGLSEFSTKIFLDKGRKIANECKRLPIAIAAIASSLKGKQRREEWDVALKSLQKHMSMHGVDDELVKIYKCLKFSYDNMNHEKAKKLFLLCSVFREDEEIRAEKLTRLCIGAGLFGEDYGSYEDARSQVVISKNKLLDSCLLLEADQSRVKMHDLVRDAAQWIANKEIQTVQLYDKNQKAMVEREENIKYLLCESKLTDVFSCKIDGSKLEIILIVTMYKGENCQDMKIEFPNSFFENNTSLRVFHLLHDRYHQLALSLPQSIQSLKNIRSLLFMQVDLGDISVLGNLPSLETLDLDRCKINELPRGITKLEKFRLLNLECCYILRNNPFEVIEGCSSLEELYFRNSFNGFCREITFPKLQRFCIDEYWNSVNDPPSKYVSIVNKDGVFLSETTLKYCMQAAEVLRVRRIEGRWRNIIPEIIPIDQGMNDLFELSLSYISQLQCLVNTKHIKHTDSQLPNVFSKLVVLNLYKLENLEELCNGPLSFDSMKSLEKLSIKDCKHLRSLFKCNLNLCNLKSVSLEGCPVLISLFQISIARSLVLLETLEIIDCKCFEYIIMDERNGEESRGEIVDDDNDRSHDLMFLKLKVLTIKKCPGSELILPFLSAHDLPALESITMTSCDKLKYIFGQHVELGSLKKMELDGLPNLIDIYPECYGTMISPIKEPSSVSRDTCMPQTHSDPIKCNIFSWTNIFYKGKKLEGVNTACTKTTLVFENQLHDHLIAKESNSCCLNLWEQAQCLSRQSHILCNVKEIKLCNISKIKSVFILTIAPRMLLETLTIRDCDELKQIITDVEDHDSGGILGNVFPKLKMIYVEDCVQLEYIFGHYTEYHQNHTESRLHLPALESLHLWNLPSLVAVCPKQYHTTFPPLKDLELKECSPIANIKSIGNFITRHSVTRSVEGTTVEELNGKVENFLALERIKVYNSKVENIFFVEEVIGQQLNLELRNIKLRDLPTMTCIFVGPKNSFVLKNLTWIKLLRCEKLEIIFSGSISICLPQLLSLRIEECKELKHIIEGNDLENNKSSNTKTCFPKLITLVVIKCNKLKCVFPISICKELPELKAIMIRESYELEEIFKSEVEIPNLACVVFENLPSLCHAQGIQFQAVKNRLVQNCQKLSLTSASNFNSIHESFSQDTGYDRKLVWDVMKLFAPLQLVSEGHDTRNENPSAETTKDVAAGIEVEAISEHKLISPQIKMKQTRETDPDLEIPSVAILPTNSEELMYEQTRQQHPLGETYTTFVPSEKNNLEDSTSEKTVASTLPTISQTRNKPPIQLVSPKPKGIEISVEEGTTSAGASSTHLELEGDDGQIAMMTSFSTATAETKDEGDDLSSSLLITRELEQLVSEKHLDHENLPLLTDFLVKHPSVRLEDTSLRNRYKGCAYNLLAELLKFLKTHSVLDVFGSCHSEFVELLLNARNFGFDMNWLDGVERRTLFPDIEISKVTLQKLLDSKQQVTKDVELLRLKIGILSQHVEDLKHQLTSSEAVLETIIQQETALSAPIDY